MRCWLSLAAGLLVLVPPAVGDAATARRDLDSALEYLRAFAEGPGMNDDMAAYIAEAATAAGLDIRAWPPQRPLLPLVQEALEERRVGIRALRPLHALALAGAINATHPSVQAALADVSDGQFGDPALVNDDIWSLIVLPLAGVPTDHPHLQAGADHILANQGGDGGWSWQGGGGPSDTDDTGMALVALAQVGRLDAQTARRGIAFIADQTNIGGGVGLVKESGTNCDSTVWAIRAHAAAQAPIPQRAWQYLQGQRAQDGGYRYSYGPETQQFCTAEVAALLGDAIHHCWDVSGYGGRGDPAPGCPALSQGSPGVPALALGAVLLLAARVRRSPQDRTLRGSVGNP